MTVLPLATCLSENVALPPLRLTSSPETAPLSDRPVIVAVVVPS